MCTNLIINVVEVDVLRMVMELSDDPTAIVQSLVEEQTVKLFEDYIKKEELNELIPMLNQQ